MLPPTVVIVEDHPEVAEMLSEMMRLIGFDTLTALSSPSALDLIKKRHPALVILDVMMPDVSGLDVVRSMRLISELNDVPVLIVSSLAQSQDVTTGLAAGASAYLTKPVDFSELMQIVQTLTER